MSVFIRGTGSDPTRFRTQQQETKAPEATSPAQQPRTRDTFVTTPQPAAAKLGAPEPASTQNIDTSHKRLRGTAVETFVLTTFFGKYYDNSKNTPDFARVHDIIASDARATRSGPTPSLAPIPADVVSKLDPRAYANQLALVDARIELGKAQELDLAHKYVQQGKQELANLERIAQAGATMGDFDVRDVISEVRSRVAQGNELLAAYPNPDAVSKRLADAQAKVNALEKVESQLPLEEVQKARLPVTIARFEVLEQSMGTEKAVELWRQNHYNGGYWPLIGGRPEISAAKVNQSGLPHGEFPSEVPDGYNGTMRTPDGAIVDLGHVPCGLDFHLNASEVPKSYYGKQNVFDDYAATLTGDLTTVTLNTWLATESPDFKGSNVHTIARQVGEGYEGAQDYRGDIDSANLWMQYDRRQPGQTLSDLLKDYYFGGNGQAPGYVNRATTFGDNCSMFEKGPDGAYRVKRDQQQIVGTKLSPETGNEVPDAISWGRADEAVYGVANFTSKFRLSFAGQGPEIVKASTDAFADWLNREAQGKNGPNDRPLPPFYPIWADR